MKTKTFSKKFIWGEDPEGSGPRNYFRETLIVQNLEKRVRKGSILDAGCGNGSLSRRLAERGYRVEAIDTAIPSIAFLEKKAKQKKIEKKLHAQVGSIFALPFAKAYFDGIVCGEVLEHLKNDRKAIKEFFRVLKSGGTCVVTVPAKMNKWDSVDDISGHERRYTKEELTSKFIDEGFHVISCTYWGFPLTNFWHDNVFRPFLEKKMETGFKVSDSQSIIAKAMRNEKIVKFFSNLFVIDRVFDSTGLGNSLILVAIKK